MGSTPDSNPTSPVRSDTWGRRRRTSVNSFAHSVASATENIIDRELPLGFVAATAEASTRTANFHDTGGRHVDDEHAKRNGGSRNASLRRMSRGSRNTSGGLSYGHEHHPWGLRRESFPGLSEESTNLSEEPSNMREDDFVQEDTKPLASGDSQLQQNTVETDAYNVTSLEAGEHIHTRNSRGPSPKRAWASETVLALKRFGAFVLTPLGFLITLYGLNVVAWGGMLFLLLCNASHAMCWTSDGHGGKFFDCNNLYSPRREWIEVDSQILNALFCVTGFGLAPWRFRDLYYLYRFRCTSERKHGLQKKMVGLRKLAGYYRSWFRLPGSDTLGPMPEAGENSIDRQAMENDVRVPLPVSKRSADPVTGNRAAPTALWKVDFFVWCQVWNTFFQCCLAGFMWGLNRFDRPSWSTGLFVALACIVVAIAGVMSYIEGRKIKRVEGAHVVAPGENGDMDMGLYETRTGSESGHGKGQDDNKSTI